jgi:hypothetical protein
VAALLSALFPAQWPEPPIETIGHRFSRPAIGESGIGGSGTSEKGLSLSPEGDWLEHAHDGLAMLGSAAERHARERLVSIERHVETLEAYASSLAAAVQRKDGDLVIAHTALEDMAGRARGAEDDRRLEREGMERQLALLERRASTAETWAGVLAREVERKDADLAIAHSALDAIARGGGAAAPDEHAADSDTDETVAGPDR